MPKLFKAISILNNIFFWVLVTPLVAVWLTWGSGFFVCAMAAVVSVAVGAVIFRLQNNIFFWPLVTPVVAVWLTWGSGFFVCSMAAVAGVAVGAWIFGLQAALVDSGVSAIPSNAVRDDVVFRMNPSTGEYEETDVRTTTETQFQNDRRSGKALGPDIIRFIDDLIQIGRGEGFISKDTGPAFESRNYHRRAREIGEALDRLGGLTLMQEVYYRVRRDVSQDAGRGLEHAWRGIGRWEP